MIKWVFNHLVILDQLKEWIHKKYLINKNESNNLYHGKVNH